MNKIGYYVNQSKICLKSMSTRLNGVCLKQYRKGVSQLRVLGLLCIITRQHTESERRRIPRNRFSEEGFHNYLAQFCILSKLMVYERF